MSDESIGNNADRLTPHIVSNSPMLEVNLAQVKVPYQVLDFLTIMSPLNPYPFVTDLSERLWIFRVVPKIDVKSLNLNLKSRGNDENNLYCERLRTPETSLTI